MIASVINASVRSTLASDDAALAYSALSWASRAVTLSAGLIAIFMAPWYIGWLLALFIAVLVYLAQCLVINALSEDSFESAGKSIGNGINAVRGLFSRAPKVAVATTATATTAP